MEPWIGCDLDGTLARYERGHFREFGPYHIGEPIPKMVQRVKQHLAEGVLVKIVTARCDGDLRAVEAIQAWCLEHIGVKLPVTCEKDYGMILLYDDRAVQIISNTGERADGLD